MKGILFFDLEFYVPPNERNIQKKFGSLIFNPTKSSHLILGGHFISTELKENQILRSNSFWLWNYSSEKELLKEITTLFIQEWLFQKAEKSVILKKKVQDLITCGFSIDRVDLPALFTKSSQYQIENSSKLYNIFLKTKVIDLSNISSFIFPEDLIFYPKTFNEVQNRLIPNLKQKNSGKKVWEYYDNSEFEKIEMRCTTEVQIMLKIYKKLQNKLKKLYGF